MRVFPVLLLGLIAGILGDASRWALGTGEWASVLPWLRDSEWVAPHLVTKIIHILLGLAAAWVVFTVPLRRALVIVLLALVLCFTGSAALSLHEIVLDPFPPAFSLLLGALAGWLMKKRRQAGHPPLEELFDGRLSEESIRKLSSTITAEDLAGENRPIIVLTCNIHDAAELRRKVGPSAFLAITGEFRKRATGLLLTRRALLLPGSGEMVQACFGVPKADASDAAGATESGSLLLAALNEYFRQQSAPRPEFSVTLLQGIAATGIVDGVYEVAGDVLEQCRHLCENSPSGQVTIDPASAAFLPIPTIVEEPIPQPEPEPISPEPEAAEPASVQHETDSPIQPDLIPLPTAPKPSKSKSSSGQVSAKGKKKRRK